jgi:hypothetical protein
MIDAQLAAFLQDGLGIHIGTRTAEMEPNGARGLAVKVEDAGRQMIVYVPTVAAHRVLPDLETTGHAAVVFDRPTDDLACQVKGIFVESRAATTEERFVVLAQWNGYLDKLGTIGIPRAVAAGWVNWPAVAIRLRVTALFNQTPGPDAGTVLR